jgi:hypothetical protein
MEKGSAVNGILGALFGILMALLAIFIGAKSVRLTGGDHEPPVVHGH